MKILLEKYPDGLASFQGSLEPTNAKMDKDTAYDSASDDSGVGIPALAQQKRFRPERSHRTVAEPEYKLSNSAIEDWGVKATHAADLKSPVPDENTTVPRSEHLASASTKRAGESGASVGASTNGSKLYNAFGYVAGKLNPWA